MIKHLESHSTSEESKQESESPSKLVKIAVTCLSLLKGNIDQAKDTTRGFSLSPLDTQVLERTANIVNNLLKAQRTCQSLQPVLAELVLYQNIDKLKKQPDQIGQLLRRGSLLPPSPKDSPIEMTITTKSLLVSTLFRAVDSHSIFSNNPELDAEVA